MLYDAEAGCYIKIYENVAKGEYHFKIAENKSWDISYGHDGGNCYLNVEDDGSTVVITFKDGNVTCAADTPASSDKETDNIPDKTPDEDHVEPAVKLNFFQRIWLAITTFFKRLFGHA